MSKVRDAIIGHAVGDAMGVPSQFCLREHLLKKPITEMVYSQKVGQPAGSWSDDTSMEISTIESYIECGKFDYNDIMQKWVDWITKGEYTPAGSTFDVGDTCLYAIRQFSKGVEPLKCGLSDEYSNGNGSLMRILPVALYSYYKKLSDTEIVKLTDEMSSLTHGHNISKMSCYIYIKYIGALLDGKTKEEAYIYIQNLDYSMYDIDTINRYYRILKNDIRKYSIDEIKSTCYVVDTLECVFWIFLNSKDYRETIIASTNIGNDTDTIGGIAGSMAGIVYGIDSIPSSWLDKLQRKEYLFDLADKYDNCINDDIEILDEINN